MAAALHRHQLAVAWPSWLCGACASDVDFASDFIAALFARNNEYCLNKTETFACQLPGLQPAHGLSPQGHHGHGQSGAPVLTLRAQP